MQKPRTTSPAPSASPARAVSRRAVWLTLAVLAAPFLVSPWAQRPEDARLLVLRADEYLESSDASRALREFERAARLDPSSHDALNGMARALDAQNQQAASAAVLEQILALADAQRWPLPERRAALRNVAFSHWKLDDVEAALAALSTLQAESAGTLRTDMLLVLGHLLQGNESAAQQCHADLLQRYGAVEAVWRLGMLVSVGAAPPCERRLCEVLLGLRSQLPRLPELREELESALANGCHPDVASAVLAERAIAEGQPELASEAFARIADGALAALRDLGQARVALQQEAPRRALVELQEAARDANASVETLQFFRALSLSMLEQMDAARSAAQRGLAVDPLSVRLQHLLAEIERRAGHTPSAIAAFRSVLVLAPRHAPSLFMLGALLMETSSHAAGREYLQRYLRFHPRGPEAATARQLLSGR